MPLAVNKTMWDNNNISQVDWYICIMYIMIRYTKEKKKTLHVV